MKHFWTRLAVAALLVAIVALVGIGATAMAAARGEWQPNTWYAVGDTVTYQGVTYQCLQAHTSLVGWEPPNVPALWRRQGTATTPPPTTPPATSPPPTSPPPTTPPPSGNLALNRPATSSSNENSTFVARNAVDGNTGTRWSSAFSDPQWIYVDLGASYTINRVVLNWEAAYGRAYQIQVSTNASTWSTIYSTTTGNGAIDDLNVSGSGRYIRMYGTARGTQWGYSLWEFQIFSGSAPPPTTPPPTTPPPTTPPPPPPPTGRMFAPYLDVSPGPGSALGNLAGNAGSVSRHYTLAFILGRGCLASWFGTFPLDTAEANAWGTRINELRAAGGDVIIAFGGAAAPELANVCSSVSALQAQYQAVITKYNLRYMDMDIEDFSPTAIDLRNKALKNLEAANPNLRVHYTLGVLPTGMTQAQLDVLNNARANGTRVDVVNIMAMDYYQGVTDMGGAAIQAAQATRSQLNSMGFTNTQIGITPMIGRNDSPETFTLEDAQQVVTWARSNGIALLAFWSVGRDNGGCPNGTVSPSCSGIAQSQFQFSSIFRGFTQ